MGCSGIHGGGFENRLASFTPEQRADMQARRAERKAKWDAMSPEERDAAKAARGEHHGHHGDADRPEGFGRPQGFGRPPGFAPVDGFTPPQGFVPPSAFTPPTADDAAVPAFAKQGSTATQAALDLNALFERLKAQYGG